MKSKIKNTLIKLKLFQTIKFIIVVLNVIRIKLFFPLFFFRSLPFKYKIILLSDETIIENLLRERNLYHPVSDYKFSMVNAIKKKCYAYMIESDDDKFIIPFLHYCDNTGGV